MDGKKDGSKKPGTREEKVDEKGWVGLVIHGKLGRSAQGVKCQRPTCARGSVPRTARWNLP